jgi:MFS family permease
LYVALSCRLGPIGSYSTWRTDLAFIAYWGIVLFGYDTGIAGGVVSQLEFQKAFGLVDETGKVNKARVTEVSSNVVSVLQAGAFFGALGSAPISGWIGRRMTLLAFSLIFLVGAVSVVVCSAQDRSADSRALYRF